MYKSAMKLLWQTPLLIAVLTGLTLSIHADTTAAVITVKPAPDESLLINPGKGFVEYYGATAYTKSVIGVGYSRCVWSILEPSEGVYNWSPIDNFITASAHMEQLEREKETARILRDNQSRNPLEPLLIKVATIRIYQSLYLSI